MAEKKPVSTRSAKIRRFSNSQGTIIPMHHAFKTLHLGSVSRVSAATLPILFVALVWTFLPNALEFWSYVFSFWMTHIYDGQVGQKLVNILDHDVFVPYPLLEAEAPSSWAVHANLAICILGLVITWVIPVAGAPLNYFMRTVLLVQGSASIDRIVSPDFFPYTLSQYLIDAEIQCAYMGFLLPILLGLVYYIFDFSIWRKILLTCMIMGYFLILIPFQYMLHAYIIHEFGLLFLPLMYIMFGVLLDVLMFVSLYAYGMSWESRQEALQGRGI